MLKKWTCIISALLLLWMMPVNAETELTVRDGIEVPAIDNMKEFDIPQNEAMAFVREMKTGWVLGNTFDAFYGETRASRGSVEMEKSWVGVKTTREVIAAVKEAGFNAIRIPVSWHNHVDENNRIDPVWLVYVK